jgi:hypothetical protein
MWAVYGIHRSVCSSAQIGCYVTPSDGIRISFVVIQSPLLFCRVNLSEVINASIHRWSSSCSNEVWNSNQCDQRKDARIITAPSGLNGGFDFDLFSSIQKHYELNIGGLSQKVSRVDFAFRRRSQISKRVTGGSSFSFVFRAIDKIQRNPMA